MFWQQYFNTFMNRIISESINVKKHIVALKSIDKIDTFI